VSFVCVMDVFSKEQMLLFDDRPGDLKSQFSQVLFQVLRTSSISNRGGTNVRVRDLRRL
jgi:hypothetical protein